MSSHMKFVVEIDCFLYRTCFLVENRLFVDVCWLEQKHVLVNTPALLVKHTTFLAYFTILNNLTDHRTNILTNISSTVKNYETYSIYV